MRIINIMRLTEIVWINMEMFVETEQRTAGTAQLDAMSYLLKEEDLSATWLVRLEHLKSATSKVRIQTGSSLNQKCQ